MKKALLVILSVILMFSLIGCTPEEEKEQEVALDPIEASVETWEAPEAFGRNDNYKVEVSEDGEKWQELAVYNVKNGHQLGDPLINQGGAVYFGEPYIASLAIFDFTGAVGIRVTYKGDTLEEGGYVISPASYNVPSKQSGNTVTFTLKQDAESPRKVVFRPAGQWEAETLHIMTNVPEDEYAVDETASNVYVIEEGQEIPRTLPEGKDTYYFKKGIHTLPAGYWVDIDLGSVQQVESFDLLTPQKQAFILPGGVCFEIQARSSEDEAWQSVYESSGKAAEENFNLEGIDLSVSARYFRLILNGNYNVAPVGDYRYVHTANIQEFTLYDGEGNNLSLHKAVAGSASDYNLVTDGAAGGNYGYAYAGETFSAQSGYTYYLEKGAVVKGAFISENTEDVTICGRGILDSSDLLSTHDLSEGRNGSIHFEYCKNVVVEGITIMHAPMWMVVINYSENVLVDGINLFGYCTNADGIHFSASKNAVATGCFIRSTDDLFVAYHYGDSDGLTFKNSVLWSDGARVLLLGLDTRGDIRNVTMENCDVITYQNVWSLQESGGFAQIIATGGNTIENITIKDVRIDEVRFPVIAQFMQIRTGNDSFGTGFIKNVSLENVSFASECKPKSMISVVIPGGSIEGVSMKNVSIHGDTVAESNISEYFDVDPGITVSFE